MLSHKKSAVKTTPLYTNWGLLKLRMIEERFPYGITHCEYCETLTPAEELEAHHMIFHREKGAPYLDVPQNLCLVCHKCHSEGLVNSYSARRWFWELQISRGYDMAKWIESLPSKVKPRF